MFDPSNLDLDINKKDNDKSKDIKKENPSDINKNNEKKGNLFEKENNKNKSIDNFKEKENIEGEKTEINKEQETDDILGTIVNNLEKEEKNTEEEEKNKDGTDTITTNQNDNSGIIYDININSLNDVLNVLKISSYDYVVFEPGEVFVKLIFKKDQINKEIKNIKYHIYSNILIQAKKASGMKIDIINKTQEGKGEISLLGEKYNILTKTTPNNFGENLFLKINSLNINKNETKIKNKVNLGKLFGFLGALLIVLLIIGGAFITFIVLNAKTVDDVNFFVSLGIDLNDINNFIGIIVQFIFSILIFIETIFLAVFLFKFLLTKKQFKKKKVSYGIISLFILFIFFISGGAWMGTSQKVSSLPRWEIYAMGDVQVYDNSMLSNEEYKDYAKIENLTNIIGPVTIKFDLEAYVAKEKIEGFNINRIIWNFGGIEDTQETIETFLIKDFNQKGIYELTIEAFGTDSVGKNISKKVQDELNFSISDIVNIEERKIDTGGKIVSFDASDLSNLGKIEWYIAPDYESPVLTSYKYNHSVPIFKDTIFGMNIVGEDPLKDTLDKIFIIKGDNDSGIDGRIVYEENILDDLEYEFKVENIQNTFGEGYVEEFKWIIGDDEEIIKGNINNQEESSKLKYSFKNYGEKLIRVILTNSLGKTKELKTTINLIKKIGLEKHLSFSSNEGEIKNYKYDPKNNEYFIDRFSVPNNLILNAKLVKTEEAFYSLNKVEWDKDSDGDIDYVGNVLEYPIGKSGNSRIRVKYTFEHRITKGKFITLEENIYVESLLRDDLLSMKIEKDSNYVPIIVRFDGSKSSIKGENIIKFIWDFGDGTKPEERDGIVEGHKYISAGEYEVKMSVVTESGKTYSLKRMLVLNPIPKKVEITSSMKKVPTFQGIDFSSEKSEGQIISYLWNFGDGNTSTEANPSHTYTKEGKYNVVLTIEFDNRDIQEDTVEIIVED